MNDTVLTPERILMAAEEVLRRYGPAKATVIDVARALGVSHGSVYRHFPSKAALRDAVVQRWLHRVAEPLMRHATEFGPAPQRLRAWFDALRAAKRGKVLGDPEMFAAYAELCAEAREVVDHHVELLSTQVQMIIADGMAQGQFATGDAAAAAKAVFDATTRFHNPVHAAEWTLPGHDAAFEAVFGLILRGLGAAPPAAV